MKAEYKKDISVKVFLLGTISTVFLTVFKYFTSDYSKIHELLIPSLIIWIMILFVSVLLFSEADDKEKEEKRNCKINELENRIENLEEEIE